MEEESFPRGRGTFSGGESKVDPGESFHSSSFENGTRNLKRKHDQIGAKKIGKKTAVSVSSTNDDLFGKSKVSLSEYGSSKKDKLKNRIF